MKLDSDTRDQESKMQIGTTTRRRRIGAILAALTLAAAVPPGAHAIGNGEMDGTAHPNVGLLTIQFQEGGDRTIGCTGWYAGPRTGDAGTAVFVTAGHCVDWLAEAGVSPSQLAVTFDPEVAVDGDTWAVTATNWQSAVAYDNSEVDDYGVVLLSGTVGAPPLRFPTSRRLDDLAARGALRPETLFDNVGYGANPSFKGGPVQFAFAPGRMFSTSRFLGLTRSTLKLLMNEDAGYGGVCYFDSGAPALEHGTDRVVAITAGGDPRCRAQAHPLRLDVPAARSFYGRYLELP